jgi:hypothetical protein
MNKYEVTAYEGTRYICEAYPTAAAAEMRAEDLGSASVTLFRGRPNLPDRAPAIVFSCVRLWSFNQERGWGGHYIYDGVGALVDKTRPTTELCA